MPDLVSQPSIRYSLPELLKVLEDGPWPDRELELILRTSDIDEEPEIALHNVYVGVGFIAVNSVADSGHYMFPCKFVDEPELFILEHRNGKFWFKGDQCWVEPWRELTDEERGYVRATPDEERQIKNLEKQLDELLELAKRREKLSGE